jgi:hypothetical protein
MNSQHTCIQGTHVCFWHTHGIHDTRVCFDAHTCIRNKCVFFSRIHTCVHDARVFFWRMHTSIPCIYSFDVHIHASTVCAKKIHACIHSFTTRTKFWGAGLDWRFSLCIWRSEHTKRLWEGKQQLWTHSKQHTARKRMDQGTSPIQQFTWKCTTESMKWILANIACTAIEKKWEHPACLGRERRHKQQEPGKTTDSKNAHGRIQYGQNDKTTHSLPYYMLPSFWFIYLLVHPVLTINFKNFPFSYRELVRTLFWQRTVPASRPYLAWNHDETSWGGPEAFVLVTLVENCNFSLQTSYHAVRKICPSRTDCVSTALIVRVFFQLTRLLRDFFELYLHSCVLFASFILFVWLRDSSMAHKLILMDWAVLIQYDLQRRALTILPVSAELAASPLPLLPRFLLST